MAGWKRGEAEGLIAGGDLQKLTGDAANGERLLERLRGTAQAEDVCCLLGGDLLVARQDADRLTVAQGLDDLLEDPVELLGELDAVVLAGTARKNAGSGEVP